MREIWSPHSPSHWGPWCHMHCGLGAPAMGWRSVASYPWQGGNSFEDKKNIYINIAWKSKTKQRMVFRVIHVKDSLLQRGKVWSLDFLGIYEYIFFTHFGSFKYCWFSLRQHEHRDVATRPSSFEKWVCRIWPGALCAALNSAGCCCVSPGFKKSDSRDISYSWILIPMTFCKTSISSTSRLDGCWDLNQGWKNMQLIFGVLLEQIMILTWTNSMVSFFASRWF